MGLKTFYIIFPTCNLHDEIFHIIISVGENIVMDLNNVVVGMVVVLKIWPGEPGTEAPILAYWACSVSNTIGPACGILALKYISYPAQVSYCK